MDPIDFSKIILPSKLNVTEQEIDISTLTENQRKFYTDLFNELLALYNTKQKNRLIVGIAGPAGSGKSMSAAIFEEIAKQSSLPFLFESVGIDAFHYPNDFLIAHTSEDEALKNHKGRFDTYDVGKLVTAMKRFSAGEEVLLPTYSRKTHDPVPDTITIKKDQSALLLVEGLWVLYGERGWEKVGELLDFSIFIEADKEVVKQGVIKRHMKGGRDFEDAVRYYEDNEEKYFDLIMQTRRKADKVIPACFGVEK